MSKLCKDLLIATAVMAGLYAAYGIASSTAIAMAASFAPGETVSHTRTIEFTKAAKLASVEREEARAKCVALPRAQRDGCRKNAFQTVPGS